jgi:hypothetical protein
MHRRIQLETISFLDTVLLREIVQEIYNIEIQSTICQASSIAILPLGSDAPLKAYHLIVPDTMIKEIDRLASTFDFQKRVDGSYMKHASRCLITTKDYTVNEDLEFNRLPLKAFSTEVARRDSIIADLGHEMGVLLTFPQKEEQQITIPVGQVLKRLAEIAKDWAPRIYRSITVNEEDIRLITQRIDIRYKGKTYLFGPYEVRIPYALSGIVAYNIEFRYAELPDTIVSLSPSFMYIHPHIRAFSVGDSTKTFLRACWGNYEKEVSEALQAGNIDFLLMAIGEFLPSVYASNWYVGIDGFARVPADSYFKTERISEGSFPKSHPFVADYKYYPGVTDYYELYKPESMRQRPGERPPWVTTSMYITPYLAADFDEEGYDPDGYDDRGWGRDGFDKEGWGRAGYHRDGFDRTGRDREGFGRDGFHWRGHDRDGYNRDGYDPYGYNRDLVNREGVPARRVDPDEEFFDFGSPDPLADDLAGMHPAFVGKSRAEIIELKRQMISRSLQTEAQADSSPMHFPMAEGGTYLHYLEISIDFPTFSTGSDALHAFIADLEREGYISSSMPTRNRKGLHIRMSHTMVSAIPTDTLISLFPTKWLMFINTITTHTDIYYRVKSNVELCPFTNGYENVDDYFTVPNLEQPGTITLCGALELERHLLSLSILRNTSCKEDILREVGDISSSSSAPVEESRPSIHIPIEDSSCSICIPTVSFHDWLKEFQTDFVNLYLQDSPLELGDILYPTRLVNHIEFTSWDNNVEVERVLDKIAAQFSAINIVERDGVRSGEKCHTVITSYANQFPALLQMIYLFDKEIISFITEISIGERVSYARHKYSPSLDGRRDVTRVRDVFNAILVNYAQERQITITCPSSLLVENMPADTSYVSILLSSVDTLGNRKIVLTTRIGLLPVEFALHARELICSMVTSSSSFIMFEHPYQEGPSSPGPSFHPVEIGSDIIPTLEFRRWLYTLVTDFKAVNSYIASVDDILGEQEGEVYLTLWSERVRSRVKGQLQELFPSRIRIENIYYRSIEGLSGLSVRFQRDYPENLSRILLQIYTLYPTTGMDWITSIIIRGITYRRVKYSTPALTMADRLDTISNIYPHVEETIEGLMHLQVHTHQRSLIDDNVELVLYLLLYQGPSGTEDTFQIEITSRDTTINKVMFTLMAHEVLERCIGGASRAFPSPRPPRISQPLHSLEYKQTLCRLFCIFEEDMPRKVVTLRFYNGSGFNDAQWVDQFFNRYIDVLGANSFVEVGTYECEADSVEALVMHTDREKGFTISQLIEMLGHDDMILRLRSFEAAIVGEDTHSSNNLWDSFEFFYHSMGVLKESVAHLNLPESIVRAASYISDTVWAESWDRLKLRFYNVPEGSNTIQSLYEALLGALELESIPTDHIALSIEGGQSCITFPRFLMLDRGLVIRTLLLYFYQREGDRDIGCSIIQEGEGEGYHNRDVCKQVLSNFNVPADQLDIPIEGIIWHSTCDKSGEYLHQSARSHVYPTLGAEQISLFQLFQEAPLPIWDFIRAIKVGSVTYSRAGYQHADLSDLSRMIAESPELLTYDTSRPISQLTIDFTDEISSAQRIIGSGNIAQVMASSHVSSDETTITVRDIPLEISHSRNFFIHLLFEAYFFLDDIPDMKIGVTQ